MVVGVVVEEGTAVDVAAEVAMVVVMIKKNR